MTCTEQNYRKGIQKLHFLDLLPKMQRITAGMARVRTHRTIPTDLVNPCFYADAGDTVVYNGGQRDGYWDEVYTIRNAEAKKSSKDEVKDVVDIAKDTFTRASDTLYVNSTFYDYYTDYELNGNNRDSYSAGGYAVQVRETG